MRHTGERVAPLCAYVVRNIFVAAGERNRLESDRLNLIDVLRRELDDLANRIIVDAVDDRDDERDFDPDFRQIFNRANFYVEQIAYAAMFVLLFADTVDLQIDAALAGSFRLLAKL